ncbi:MULTISPECIES: hypothetical protein [Pseudomonas]|nr:hypothetical protein [Pseudomonas veronii]WRU66193.1 hypothetical protein VPH48_32745 [Pseudomonas veronii]
MTAKEQNTLKSLQSKWAERTATPREVKRCMELEQKARAAARS